MTAFGVSKFSRKPFDVEAIRLTNENMLTVAKWAGATVEMKDGEACLYVPVRNAMHEGQKWGSVGDWIVKAGRGYKVYQNATFNRTFMQTQEGAYFLEEVPLPMAQKAGISEEELSSLLAPDEIDAIAERADIIRKQNEKAEQLQAEIEASYRAYPKASGR